jgi:hypothetical protein
MQMIDTFTIYSNSIVFSPFKIKNDKKGAGGIIIHIKKGAGGIII